MGILGDVTSLFETSDICMNSEYLSSFSGTLSSFSGTLSSLLFITLKLRTRDFNVSLRNRNIKNNNILLPLIIKCPQSPQKYKKQSVSFRKVKSLNFRNFNPFYSGYFRGRVLTFRDFLYFRGHEYFFLSFIINDL